MEAFTLFMLWIFYLALIKPILEHMEKGAKKNSKDKKGKQEKD